MLLMPPPKDCCPACAVKHDPSLPHDATSLYYQYRFYGLRGRWPTWSDAAAHCRPEVVTAWQQSMQESGVEWTEPPEGTEVIADPPAETINQAVGDLTSPSFGPDES